jgi:hypothetical protein
MLTTIRTLPRYCWILLLALICLILGACSRSSILGPPTPAVEESAAVQAGMAGLDLQTHQAIPVPRTVLAASTPGPVVQAGARFMRLPFPQRVAAMDSCEALFAPDFSSQHRPPLANLSYAFYSFDMTTYSGAESVQMHWLNGVQPGKVWLGLPDWSNNLWRWFQVPASGVVNTPFASFIKDQQLLALVATVGNQQLWLRQINLGQLDSWSRSYGGADYDAVAEVFVDAADNIYAAGQSSSFTGGSNAALVLKYSPAGVLLWAKTFSLPGADLYVTDWVASPDGTVAGLASQRWENPPGTFNDGALVFTLTPDGQLGWSKLWQLPYTNYPASIGAFPDGSFAVTCTIDADNVDPVKHDGAVLRLSPAGEMLTAHGLDLGGADSFYGMNVRPGDGALIAGFSSYPPGPPPPYIKGSLELPLAGGVGPATQLPVAAVGSDGSLLRADSPLEAADIFIKDLSLTHWDASGGLLWAIRFDIDDNENGWNAAFEPDSSNTFLVGRTNVAGLETPVVAQFDASGGLLRADTWCPGGECYTLAFDSQANLVVAFTGATDARGIWKPLSPAITPYTPDPVSAVTVSYTSRTLDYPLVDGPVELSTPTGAVTDIGGGNDDMLVIKRDKTEL